VGIQVEGQVVWNKFEARNSNVDGIPVIEFAFEAVEGFARDRGRFGEWSIAQNIIPDLHKRISI
jgi:hypothetical protein